MSSPTIDKKKKKAAYARSDKRKRENSPVKGSRWTEKEHEKLAKGLAQYGKDNQKLAALIPARTKSSTVIYISRNYSKLLQDSIKYKNKVDDDDEDAMEEEEKEEEDEDESEVDNDEVQQVTSTPGKQKWSQKEHEKIAKGLARYGKDKQKLAALIPYRSAGAVNAYISRKHVQLMSDSKKYDNATEENDDDEDDSEEEEEEVPPPKKKAKRDENPSSDTEPVGFMASLNRFLSGSWFWPSSMPTDNDNDDGGNDDGDDDDDEDDDGDGKVSGISKGDEDGDDLLHLLPDVGIQFLNSINITTHRELLCAKTFELGEKYALFREENDLYAYSGNGAKSAISHMKKKIRDKAKEMGNTELAELNMDQRRNVSRNKTTFTPRKSKKKAPPTDDDLLQQSIPQVGVQFLNSVNIKSAKEFLTTKTGDLAAKYSSFLEENDMKSVTAQHSQVKMSTWKRKVRDAAEKGGHTELANLKIARDGSIMS